LFSKRTTAATSAARGGSAGRHDHERVATAQFEHDLLDLAPGDGGHRRPGRTGSGQRRGRHPGVAQDRLDPAGADQQGLEGSLGEPGPDEQVLVGQEALGVLGVVPARVGAPGPLLLRGHRRLAHLDGHHGRDLVLLAVQDAGCAAHPARSAKLVSR
jgi:hypothetical protein